MNLPRTAEGAACLRAAQACITDGFAVGVDLGAALAVTAALGVAPPVAAELLSACAEGLRAGMADRRSDA